MCEFNLIVRCNRPTITLIIIIIIINIVIMSGQAAIIIYTIKRVNIGTSP